ncbi:MAG: YciI family protein [Chitinophagales bacterium]
MKFISIFFILFCLFCGTSVNAQQTTTASNAEELKAYYLVILKKGPHRDQDSTTAEQIQKGHMENITKMAEAGKLNVAGPFLDDGDLRGIFVFNLSSEQEVRALVDNDPAVKAGRLIYEIHPWMTAKGTCFK